MSFGLKHWTLHVAVFVCKITTLSEFLDVFFNIHFFGEIFVVSFIF